MISMMKRVHALFVASWSCIQYLANYGILKANGVQIKGKVRINGVPYIRNHGQLVFNDKTVINSGIRANPLTDNKSVFVTTQTGKIIIGKNVGISNSAMISWRSITIGENVMIGSGCLIMDTDFHPLRLVDRCQADYHHLVNTKPVVIKPGVFLGAKCIVLKGVVIGENSIVGAGSVVGRDIPDNEIWTGNPVRFVKKLDNANRIAPNETMC
jgi:acetyltransferase-like isoleucine patch superfamily enzyme